MTIGAGFVCHEGVLLASDTLYSGINKRYGRKIWTIDRGDVVVVFAGAGTQGGLERTRYEIEQRLTSNLFDGVIESVEEALQVGVDKLPDAERTDGLFVIRVNGVCALFENSGGNAMLSPVGHAGQCIGWPTGLGQYFLDTLYPQPMPMKWARIVAAHMVKQAKRYASHCGGDTHLLEVPATGDLIFTDDQSEIATLEKHLTEIDAAMRLVLPGGGVTDATINHRLTMLNQAIEAARNAVVITGVMANIQLGSVTLEATGTVGPTPLEQTPDRDEED